MSAVGKLLRVLALVLFGAAAAVLLSNVGAWLMGRPLSVLFLRFVLGIALIAAAGACWFVARG